MYPATLAQGSPESLPGCQPFNLGVAIEATTPGMESIEKTE